MVESSAEAQWLTVTEASAHLKITRVTLYAYMRDGRLPFYYLAGTRQRRLKQSDLDALLTLGAPEDLAPSNDTDE